jgi:hypothetical protein
MANGRCRMHGGTAPRGFAASNFKTGRYSKHLPQGLLETYERSRKDPDLLALDDEISLVDSRLVELLQKLDKGESGRLWIAASEVYGYMVESLKSGDISSVNRYMSKLGDILNKGRDEFSLWRDIGEQMDRRRSLAEAERKRLVEGQYMVDVDKARTLIAALAASVRKHVTDPKSLSAISEDFLRLTAGE